MKLPASLLLLVVTSRDSAVATNADTIDVAITDTDPVIIHAPVDPFSLRGRDKGFSALDGTKGVSLAVLSPVEIDSFEASVRDFYDRPQESIPVSEGGTMYGGGTPTGQGSPASAFSLRPQKRCDDAGAITRNRCADCTAAQCTGTLDCELMPITNVCRYVLGERTRSASVHLMYRKMPASVPEPAWWFQRLEIVSAPTDVSYFSTMGHKFGYAGFQQSTETPFQGRILFSIWDQGGCDQDKNPDCPAAQVAKTVACGTGIKCENFGGEGTGRKSIVYSNDLPVTGQPYYMVTHAKKVGPFRMQYSAYFYVPGAAAWGSAPGGWRPTYTATPPGWRFLSRIEVGTDAKERWRMRNMYSFVEQWYHTGGLARRAAMFGPSFVAQDPGAVTAASFAQVPCATFNHGRHENHKHVNAFQSNETLGIGLEIGGGVVQEAVQYQKFSYPEVAPPSELVCFAEKSGCLSEATTTAEIEACLEGNKTCESKSQPSDSDPSDCTDTVGWTDKDGDTCSWYEANASSGCLNYGHSGADVNCCICQKSVSLAELKKE